MMRTKKNRSSWIALFTINLTTLGFYIFTLTKYLKTVHKLNIFVAVNLEHNWRFHTTSKIKKEHIFIAYIFEAT